MVHAFRLPQRRHATANPAESHHLLDDHFSMVWTEVRPTSAHWLGHMLPQRWGHYHVLQDHGSILPQSSGRCAANGRIDLTKGAWCCLKEALWTLRCPQSGIEAQVPGLHSKRQAQKCKHHATHSDWTHAVGAKVWKSVSMWRQCHFVDVDEAVWDWWSADELAQKRFSVDELAWIWVQISWHESDWVQMSWHDNHGGVPYYIQYIYVIYIYNCIQPGWLMGRNMGSVWWGQTFLEVLGTSL